MLAYKINFGFGEILNFELFFSLNYFKVLRFGKPLVWKISQF